MAGLLGRLKRMAAPPRPLEPAELQLSASAIPLLFKRHAQARRLVLRLNAEATAAVVTVPLRVSRAQALAFAEKSRDWIENRISAHGGSVRLAPGCIIPLRGANHEVRHVPTLRGTVTSDPVNAVIHVPGDASHLARRLADWLKRSAREELLAACKKYAGPMGVEFKRVTIRDQRSRWGSCSAKGELSFSWRLVLTPPHVLDYVAAHEVAHLKHMDHGPRFWRLVLTHCPGAPQAKRWLKAHGQSVHRVVI